ncbi:RNA-binding protein cabeza [Bienertia sinuspersici]
MPATSLPGVLSGGERGFSPSLGMLGTSTFQQSHPSTSTWSAVNVHGANNAVPFSAISEGWRSGDWICNCGFHNYSSRTQCKKCDAAPPALGIKRLAPDEPLHEWDNKRLNAGAWPAVNQYLQSYPGFGPAIGFVGNQKTGLYPTFPSGSVAVPPNVHGHPHMPRLLSASTLIGKGAKQWREGDWMCSKCNNHNYASRSECNRCKMQKNVITEPISVT